MWPHLLAPLFCSASQDQQNVYWCRWVQCVNYLNLLVLPLSRAHRCVCWPVRNERLWTCHARNHGCSSSVDQSNAATAVLLSHVLCVPLCFLSPPLPVCLQVFEQLSSYRSLQQQTDWLKERISLLLGGTQVIHVERLAPVRPIAEHYSTLSTFYRSLMSSPLRLHPRSLQGTTMLLEK